MQILWSYIVWGSLTLLAAAAVAGGEAGAAELKLAEAATQAVALACLLPEFEAPSSAGAAAEIE